MTSISFTIDWSPRNYCFSAVNPLEGGNAAATDQDALKSYGVKRLTGNVFLGATHK